MESEKIFKTKTGFCHILPDKIVLTRDGVIGNIAKITTGNTLIRVLLIYSILALSLLYFAFKAYQQENFFTGIFFSLFGLYLFVGVFSSLNNSAAPVIDRHKIKAIKLIQGITGLTRTRFVVKFEDEKGKIKNRLIMLPGSLSGGQEETQKAIQIMTEEKLLNS